MFAKLEFEQIEKLKGLNGTSVKIFIVILRHCHIRHGGCNLLINTIAEESGYCVRTVQKHINILCEKGLLRRYFRKSPKNISENISSSFEVNPEFIKLDKAMEQHARTEEVHDKLFPEPETEVINIDEYEEFELNKLNYLSKLTDW